MIATCPVCRGDGMVDRGTFLERYCPMRGYSGDWRFLGGCVDGKIAHPLTLEAHSAMRFFCGPDVEVA